MGFNMQTLEYLLEGILISIVMLYIIDMLMFGPISKKELENEAKEKSNDCK